jgi:hypothetical protein
MDRDKNHESAVKRHVDWIENETGQSSKKGRIEDADRDTSNFGDSAKILELEAVVRNHGATESESYVNDEEAVYVTPNPTDHFPVGSAQTQRLAIVTGRDEVSDAASHPRQTLCFWIDMKEEQAAVRFGSEEEMTDNGTTNPRTTVSLQKAYLRRFKNMPPYMSKMLRKGRRKQGNQDDAPTIPGGPRHTIDVHHANSECLHVHKALEVLYNNISD